MALRRRSDFCAYCFYVCVFCVKKVRKFRIVDPKKEPMQVSRRRCNAFYRYWSRNQLVAIRSKKAFILKSKTIEKTNILLRSLRVLFFLSLLFSLFFIDNIFIRKWFNSKIGKYYFK